MKVLSSVLAAAAIVVAQDPADGWMAYAVGQMPSKYKRITHLEMQWVVNHEPSSTDAFYSPWFGMDPSDNLNLIQPVNPWLGNGWVGYTEYYQWSPEDNRNSNQIDVQPGQTLHGVLDYNSATDSYTLTQTVVQTGRKSSQVVRCQNGKKFTIPYVVYEKVWPCGDYPPDGKVSFTNIKASCDGADCTNEIKWSAKVKDANCNMAAHVNSDGTIDLTWDTSLPSKYDNLTRAELFDLNFKGWATNKQLGLTRPQDNRKQTLVTTVISKDFLSQYNVTGTHYGDPKAGCEPDEQAVQVQGVAGDFCSPKCKLTKCPTDLPAGVTAKPQCALQTSTGAKYCALICSPSLPINDQMVADAQCGTNASCKPISGVGLCTYDD